MELHDALREITLGRFRANGPISGKLADAVKAAASPEEKDKLENWWCYTGIENVPRSTTRLLKEVFSTTTVVHTHINCTYHVKRKVNFTGGTWEGIVEKYYAFMNKWAPIYGFRVPELAKHPSDEFAKDGSNALYVDNINKKLPWLHFGPAAIKEDEIGFYEERHPKEAEKIKEFLKDYNNFWIYTNGLCYNQEDKKMYTGYIESYENLLTFSDNFIIWRSETALRNFAGWYRGMRTSLEFYEAAKAGLNILTMYKTINNNEQRRQIIIDQTLNALMTGVDYKVLDTDPDPQIGQLVEVSVTDENGRNTEMKLLKVECGTGREFYVVPPQGATTALEANAGTWQLKPEEYKPEIRT